MFTRIKKRGISPMIGYVLLISFVIVLGVVVYNWMKTYVPQDDLNCPDGTSLFVKDYSYSCTENSLNITLKNNGKFNVGGYFIYATTAENQELATADLTYYTEDLSRLNPTGVKFLGEFNSLVPNEEELEIFDLTGFSEERIYSVEIIPIRWQKDGRISRIVSCKDAKTREEISCS